MTATLLSRAADANFGNNWAWNFRHEFPGFPGKVWIKQIAVKRNGPKR